MVRPLSLLEAFALAEEVGAYALGAEDIFWMAEAKKRKGCVLQRSRLTAEDRRRVMSLGQLCQEWKDAHR